MTSRMKMVALMVLSLTLSSLVSANNEVCPQSGKTLMDTPKDHGPRTKGDVIPILAKPGLFDEVMAEPKCTRNGQILLAITIAPNGDPIKVSKMDSTFQDTVIENHLLELIPTLNFGQIESNLYSVVYIPFVFDK